MVENARQQQTREATAGKAMVQDYLDFMLRGAVAKPAPEPEPEVPEPSEAEHAVPANRQSAPVREESKTATQAPASPAQPAIPVVDEPLVEAVAAEPETLQRREVPPSNQLAHAAGSGTFSIPEWGEADFAALLFEVRGMGMAAPLTGLGGIVRIEDRLRPVSGQASWFMGLMRWNGRTLRVADAAALLMPEQTADKIPADSGRRRGYDCVVILDGSNWALAVDSAEETASIAEDDVRWRRERGRRDWLAGTISGRLCALLDPGVIASRLNATEESRLESAADKKEQSKEADGGS